MKSSTLPPLRVSPEPRADAEAVLAPGESLSSFVHDAVTRTIEYRRAQQEFVERGQVATLGSLRVEQRCAEDTQASARTGPRDQQAVVNRYRVRLTIEALDDLKRLQAFLIEKDSAVAARAVDAIETSFELLEYPAFSCRKAWPGDRPLLRELVIPFGSAGCVALFEIDGPGQVTIPAMRHQREDDYH